jgi:hypothetical protein
MLFESNRTVSRVSTDEAKNARTNPTIGKLGKICRLAAAWSEGNVQKPTERTHPPKWQSPTPVEVGTTDLTRPFSNGVIDPLD